MVAIKNPPGLACWLNTSTSKGDGRRGTEHLAWHGWVRESRPDAPPPPFIGSTPKLWSGRVFEFEMTSHPSSSSKGTFWAPGLACSWPGYIRDHPFGKFWNPPPQPQLETPAAAGWVHLGGGRRGAGGKVPTVPAASCTTTGPGRCGEGPGSTGVTCWLVLAAAARCKRGTRCSRRPCSGPCTWRCISKERVGGGARVSEGGAPHSTSPHPARPPGVLTCSELSREPPGFPMHLRKHLSVILCAGDTRHANLEPCAAPQTPRRPRARPGPAPHLEQLLRVGHGDLHLHLLHDDARVQLAAARAPEVRAKTTLHGSAKSTGPRPRAPRKARREAVRATDYNSQQRARPGTSARFYPGGGACARRASGQDHVTQVSLEGRSYWPQMSRSGEGQGRDSAQAGECSSSKVHRGRS